MGGFSPGIKTSVHSYGGEPRHVSIGGTAYIQFFAPSSIAHVFPNSFLMTHPPHDPHSPSGCGVASNHVFTSSAGVVVSVGCVPPYMSGGHPLYQSYNYGYVAP